MTAKDDTFISQLEQSLIELFGDDRLAGENSNILKAVGQVLDLISSEFDAEFFKSVTVQPHQNINEAWADKVRTRIAQHAEARTVGGNNGQI